MSKDNAIKLAFLVLIVVTAFVQFSSILSNIENEFLDTQFRLLRTHFPRSIENDVVIVGIDESTLEEYREPLALWHLHLGNFFSAMAVAEPAAVGVDLILPDRSYDFLIDGHDRMLLAGLLKLRNAGSLVLGQTVDEKGQLRTLFAPIIALLGANKTGLVLLKAETDGVVRRQSTSVAFEDSGIPTLGAQMVQAMGLQFQEGYIDYSQGSHYSYIPLQEVNNWQAEGNTRKLKEVFGGRAVFLGSVLPFIDRHNSPVAFVGWEPGRYVIPGMLLHAQIVRSVLADSVLQPVNVYLATLLVIVAVLFYWIATGPRLSLPLFFLFGAGLWVIATAFLWNGMILPFVVPVIIAALAIISRLTLEGIYTALEKKRLRASFGRYVSPNVLVGILNGTIMPDASGQRRELCVLFSDIRNFTSRSESESPEAIIEMLNQYFDVMTAVVHANGGTVDKFIGDGLMVFFGAPNLLENPAQNAFHSAREMLERLTILNRKLVSRGIEEIQIGIGMHLGEAVVGHVGSATRSEYTSIGDTVNLASRLEGRTKELGYPVICSATVAERLDSSIKLTPLGETPIKGRAATAVFGWRPET